MTRAAPGELPLVGRALELERMLDRFRAAEPSAFVLAGSAGVGKTRLAAELSRQVAALGLSTAHVAATQAAASIPFGPFARFLPEADAASSGDLLALLRQITSAIIERAGLEGRLLLVVDDAQLLDDGSAALVHELVQAGTCSVVTTVRTPSSVPDPITALWKDGLAERIDLDPLGPREIEQLAASVLGGPVAGATLHRLAGASGGNPLWLRELVLGAVASGALVDDRGMWTLRRPLTAPDRLAEIVAARLDGLAPATIAVVELLAAGEPLGLALLEANTEAAALDDAERQGLIEVRQDGRRVVARLAHPIYGEVLRQRLPRSRLRTLWALLAGALQATGARRQEDLLRLVTWQLDAGLPGDPELLGPAARRASQMSDKELAARLARAAFDGGGGVEAGLALGVAEFSLGRHDEAERVLAAVVPLCADDAERSKVAGARAYNLSVLMGRPEDAARVIDEALSVVTELTSRLRLLGRLATNRLFQGEPEAALDAALTLLDSPEPVMVGQGAYVASIAAALLGRSDLAVELSVRGIAAHRQSMADNHQLPEVQLIGAVLGHTAAGRLDQAQEAADIGYAACLAAGDKEGQATFSLLRGWNRCAQGRLAEAALAFREGATINREINDPGALRWCLGGVALAEGMAGHAEIASAADEELQALPRNWMMIFEAELVDRGRAWAAVAVGELSRAREVLRLAAVRAEEGGQAVAQAHLLHDIARLGHPELVAARLAGLATTVDSRLVAALAAHAGALASGGPSELAGAARTLEELGAALLAAEAHTAAARSYRAAGIARPASAHVRRAQELMRSGGDVRTPALSSTAPAERLTRREREVAQLAAAGHSSREIATRLVVSVRTVDNHLQSSYGKLGVSTREELSRVLGST